MEVRSIYETKVLAAFAAAVLVVATLAASTWKLSQDAIEAELWVSRTLAALNSIAEAQIATLQIELSTQGFRISGDAARLAERDAAIAARETSLRRIRELTADNLRQQERWARLRETADERLAISRHVELLRKTEGIKAADAYIAGAPVAETRERMFQTFREMEAEQRRLLVERGAEQARAHEIAAVVGALAALALIALLAATYFLILRQTRSTEADRRALAAVNTRIGSVLDTVVDGIITIDERGHVETVNPAVERIFGYSAAEVIGRNVKMLMPEPYRGEHDGYLERYRASGEARVIGIGREVMGRRKDGSTFALELAVSEMRLGGEHRYTGVVRDITARKQAERQIREHNDLLEQRVRERTAKLHESEERQRLMTSSVKDYAIVMIDPLGRVVTWNAGAQRLKGYAEAEILGQSMHRFYTPEDIAAGKPARLLQLAADNDRREDEGWQMRKDGTLFYANVILTALRDQAGDLLGFVKITRDITERQRTQQALRESESFVRATMDALLANICVLDEAGKIIAVNQAWRDFAAANGVDPDQVSEGANYLAVCAAATGAERATASAIAEGIRGVALGTTDRFSVEYPCHSPGQQRWYMASANRFLAGDSLRVVVSHVDITPRVQAEQKVQAQMERAEALLEATPDPVVIVDHAGRIALVNARTETVFGYARAELIGQPVELLIPQRLHAAHVAHRAPFQEHPRVRAMGAGRDLFARRKDGSEFAVDVSLSPLATPEGTLVISTVRDVTERKQAERRILGQLEHLNLLDHITRAIGERQDLRSIFQVVVRSLEDSLPIDFGCVCTYDQVANAVRVTCVGAKSAVLAHELTMDEQAVIEVDENGLSRCVQGQLVYEPDIGVVRFPFPERLARAGLGSVVMAPLRSESRVFGVLVVARCAAHSFSSIECEFLRQLSEHVALASHQVQLYTALHRAYDDLRQTQQAMMQEERLRAVGQMASGIAHDINNALSPVLLYAESMLETEKNLSVRARANLHTIQRAVEDVTQTVARMREFYRPREAQLGLTAVQMNNMVQQVLALTRARWHDMPQQRGLTIRALTELAPDLPKIMGVESEIREALTNLVFNAVDALPEGGTLTLRTRFADADPQRPAVAVEIADTGIGMDEETRRRCLEPFFTTKGERGTGLGLAMVFGMVQRHGAEIEIESAPAAGTTVRLVFAVPPAIPAEPGERLMGTIPPLSRLRLLLIDDDPLLLQSLRNTLESDGHVIVTANGGEIGIAAFRMALDRGETFAAVITDLGMPYVDGRRVATAVKETSPATPVIMLTGWGQRLVAEGDIPPHVDRMLAKPPRLRELREALAQLCQPEPT